MSERGIESERERERENNLLFHSFKKIQTFPNTFTRSQALSTSPFSTDPYIHTYARNPNNDLYLNDCDRSYTGSETTYSSRA